MFKTAIAIIIATSPAAADTITFESDGDVVFARCSSMPFTSTCELIFPQGTQDEEFTCVALDKNQEPIGVAPGPTFMTPSGVWFPELAAHKIDDVICRRR